MRAIALGKKVTLVTTAFVLAVSTLTAIVPFILSRNANAAGDVFIVRPSSLQGWSTTTATAGATASFATASAPLGAGALELKTTAANPSSVRFQKSVNVKLSDISDISFQSKVIANGGNAAVDTAFRLALDNDGNGTVDQSVVYEPYYNGTVSLGSWQSWNVKDGKFWGAWNPAGGYDSNTTLETIPGVTANTRVLAVSVGLGNWNPSVNVLVDDLHFNGDVYDFEPADTVKPVVTLLSPTINTFDSTNTDLVIQATDNIGLNKVVANIYQGATLYKSTQATAGGATEFTHTVDLANLPGIGLLPVGNYSVRYNATDLAGNVSSTKTFAFTIVDKVKPVATLVTPISNFINANDVAIQVNATDDRGLNRIVANIYKDDVLYKSTQTAAGGATSGTHNATVTLPEGTYVIRYNASDVAGNIASTGTFTITVDTTAPAAPEITSPTAGQEVTGDSVTNSWTAPEDVSGIAQYEVMYQLDGLPNAYRTETTNSRTQTFSGSYEGPITMSVRAQDGAGNWSDWSAPVTYSYKATPTENTETPGTTPGGTTTGGGTPTGGQPEVAGAQTTSDPVSQTPPLPSTTGPTAFGSVLGVTTTDSAGAQSTTPTGTSGVEGVSTEKQAAQVVGANNTNGIAFGLAWYWWLIILAAIATIIWWMVAALHNRQTENNF